MTPSYPKEIKMIRFPALPGFILAALVTAAAILALLMVEPVAAEVPAPTPAESGTIVAPPACHEDEPCWNWVTMGNGKRGVVTMWGTPVVVTVKRYCRLKLNGNLDPLTLRHKMKGDPSRAACRKIA